MIIRGPIPDHILKRMPKADRAPMGKAGLTLDELSAQMHAKLERELHALCLDICAHRGLAVGHARMDKRSTYTDGWPDLSLCINGQAVFVELKLPGRDLDPEQVKVRDLLVRPPNVARYYACHSGKEFIGILDWFTNKPGLAEQLAAVPMPPEYHPHHD